jgi:Zn-dependent metalloprotease
MRIENTLSPDSFKEKTGISAEEAIDLFSKITPEQHRKTLERIQNDPEHKKRTQYLMTKLNIIYLDEKISQLSLKYIGEILVCGPVKQHLEAIAKMRMDPEYLILKAQQEGLYAKLAEIASK